MDFLTEELIKETGLTEAQVSALKPAGETYIAEQKKAWDGKANADAEAILGGAAAKVAETTKVTRNQGEKVAEYIVRAADVHLTGARSAMETAKSEYEQKVKDFKGDEATKSELEASKKALDDAKKQLAELEGYKEKAAKYDPLETEYKSLKKEAAFTQVKPVFADTVNSYEAKAKWEEFVKNTESKYKIEIKDGEAIAIDKENEHMVKKLKDLVTSDETLTALAAGRSQKGTGAHSVPAQKIDGVPFDVPEEIGKGDELSKLIREHIVSKEGLKQHEPAYAKRFTELRNKILTKK